MKIIKSIGKMRISEAPLAKEVIIATEVMKLFENMVINDFDVNDDHGADDQADEDMDFLKLTNI